jgi:hypothetical protein
MRTKPRRQSRRVAIPSARSSFEGIVDLLSMEELRWSPLGRHRDQALARVRPLLADALAWRERLIDALGSHSTSAELSSRGKKCRPSSCAPRSARKP